MSLSSEGTPDLVAFEQLVAEYGDRVFGIALRMTGSLSDAEDVMQDAFLLAFRSWPSFRGEAAPTTWLYRITVPANSAFSATITFVNSTTGDLDLKLSDAAGTNLSSSRGFDNDEQIVCPGASPPCAGPLAPGEYILEVFPANPGMANRYDIALTVTP